MDDKKLASSFGALDITKSTLPPNRPDTPYTISAQDGEIYYIPLSRSATRLLVTGAETRDAFAIVGSGGSRGDPIGFHYHREAHDVFLCLQGSVNVWANQACRTLEAGDFASVPPGTVHSYQFLGSHTEMVGLIVPGGWEEFFRVVGDRYDGPMWPMEDDRDFGEVLLPRLHAAADKLDMVPCPGYEAVEPQGWSDSDNSLPDGLEPYFLKSASGPAYMVGGSICRPLISTKESAGRFTIACIETSGHSDVRFGLFARPGRRMSFSRVHHAFLVVQGAVDFSLGSSGPQRLHAGELVYVPEGTAFAYKTTSRFAKFYVFASGVGLLDLFQRLGEPYASPVLPEKAKSWEEEMLESVSARLGCSMTEVTTRQESNDTRS